MIGKTAFLRPVRAMQRLAVGAFALAAGSLVPVAAVAEDTAGVQVGALVCKGDGGWGGIIGSKKEFRCTYGSYDGYIKGSYTGVITKFGLDLGVTGDTTLTWVVIAPGIAVGNQFVRGSLAGNYVGVGVEATAGVGLGANALVGGSDNAYSLQPISVQVQSGVSIAAAVQTLKLTYVGPLN